MDVIIDGCLGSAKTYDDRQQWVGYSALLLNHYHATYYPLQDSLGTVAMRVEINMAMPMWLLSCRGLHSVGRSAALT